MPRSTDDDDKALFREAIRVDKRIRHDTVDATPAKKRQRQQRVQQHERLQQTAEFEFSISFQAHFPAGPVRYVADGESPYLAKQLRRGDYSPELMLDLHGLTQAEARSELVALIRAAQRQHVDCCAVMHGHGKGILRENLPHWLVQHPAIRAFHQAPAEWGGDAAILVLIQHDLNANQDDALK